MWENLGAECRDGLMALLKVRGSDFPHPRFNKLTGNGRVKSLFTGHLINQPQPLIVQVKY